MNQHRFDAAARAIHARATRRHWLAMALTAVAALLGAPPTAGAAGETRRDGEGAIEGPCGNGGIAANRCRRNRDCCTGICAKRRRGMGRCRCQRRGDPCEAARNCCGGHVCRGGVCVPPGCGPGTCPDGCCQGDACVSPPTGAACGIGGAACLACSPSVPFCIAGACAVGTWTARSTFGSGPGSAGNQFDKPWAAALSADDLTLYVADSANARVAVWTRTSASASWTAAAPIGNGSGSANDQFLDPSGLALSADGLTLYVADDVACRVSVWTRANASAPWLAQTPIGAGFGAANDQFKSPMDVALSPDERELYVSDRLNDRVCVWTRANPADPWQAQTPLGNGTGSADDQFSTPVGLIFSPDGLELLVANRRTDQISRWTRSATSQPWQAQPVFGSTGAALDQFNYPNFLALSPDALTLYIADTDNNRITIWSRSVASAAWVATDVLGAGPGTALDQFDLPYGVALSTDGYELLVVDRDNNRVVAWKKG